MRATLVARLEQCLERHRAGTLADPHLLDLLALVRDAPPPRQDLLYLQASGTSVTSAVLGMSLVRGGQVVADLPGPDDWPYKTVLDAIRDGWRVISFPNQALMLDESRTYSLGCEFVLEQWPGP